VSSTALSADLKPTTPTPDAVSGKLRFAIDRNGNFVETIIDKITDPIVLGAIVTAGCVAFSDDVANCEAIGDTIAVGIHTLIQHPSPNEYKGKYFSPGGYRVCKAK
jgi:hypothetical protein